MLPPEPGEEDDDNEQDDAEGEAERAATVLQDSLSALAKSLGVKSIWASPPPS